MYFFHKTVLFVLIILHVLLTKGTDISEEQKSLNGDLVAACSEGCDIAKIESLLARGAKLDSGYALITTAIGGDAKIAELLLSHGANVNLPYRGTDQTSLIIAIRCGHTKLAEVLLKHGANTNATPSYAPYTALMAAAQCGRKEIAELLLDHGADANIIDKNGFTAAMWADKKGHTEVGQTIRWSPLRSAWIGAVCRKQESLDLD